MIKDSENLIPKLIDSDVFSLILNGKIGIEKESMRVLGTQISKTSHNSELGSSLHNSYITTDFSEAQLELITPPYIKNKSSLDFLFNTHHFATKNLGDEYLWPLSMPPYFEDEKDIPIAYYGESNLATFKQTYRNGLSHRYGRAMQAISGIHFNYSLPDEIWSSDFFKDIEINQQKIKNNIYLRTIRNLIRFNWLILYLFGCSPVINQLFRNDAHDFKSLNKRDYFLPYATSLRMSDIGYKNSIQSDLFISLNDLKDYTRQLKDATAIKSQVFEKIFNKVSDPRSQLNSSIIQIEDEYYSVARPKSSSELDIRLSNKLDQHGIDYVELRSIDLNPFNNIGINEETINFLEIFLVFSTFTSSRKMFDSEYKACNQNDIDVSTKGREPNLLLTRNNSRISLKNWGLEIIESMKSLVDSMDIQDSKYLVSIFKAEEKLINIAKTPSDIFIKTLENENIEMLDFGKIKGEEHKNYFENRAKSQNKDWKSLEDEASDSLIKLKNLSKNEEPSFEKYIDKYFQ